MTKALNSDVGFQAPTHRHIPRSMAYAPPFYVEFINTHFDPFESTANVYFTGQSNPRLFAPYVLHPSIRTNTIDIGVQHYHCHQHEMPLQFQTLVDAHYQTHTPLSTYRLPPPLTAPLAVSEISKNHKDGCSSIFSRADAPQSYTAIFPDTRSMLVSQPTIGDGSCITKQLAPTAHEHVSIEVKPGSSNRGYMPPTPSSVPSEVISPSTQSFQQDSFGQSLPSGGTSKRSKENSRTRHYCELCEQSFTRAHDLKRHNTIHEQYKAYPCLYCSKAFGRKDALSRHIAVRGTSHDDSTKKAARKPKRSSAGQPKKLHRFPLSDELPASPGLELVDGANFAAVSGREIVDAFPEHDNLQDRHFDSSDNVSESSSRASINSLVELNGSYTAELEGHQSFRPESDTHLVRGLPSEHLLLNTTDILHAFMHPFPGPYCL